MSRSHSKMDREAKTVQAMIRLYCREQHGTVAHLCSQCRALERHALARLRHCPYQATKPTCARCPIHCYRPDMRQSMRSVMRYAGPRMLYRHPILALLHLVDGLHKPPPLPSRASPAATTPKDEPDA